MFERCTRITYNAELEVSPKSFPVQFGLAGYLLRQKLVPACGLVAHTVPCAVLMILSTTGSASCFVPGFKKLTL